MSKIYKHEGTHYKIIEQTTKFIKLTTLDGKYTHICTPEFFKKNFKVEETLGSKRSNS